MFEASRLQHSIVSGYIQIVSSGHHLPAFWAHPDLGGPFPGLVILHDYWGLTAHIRSQARRFAEMGYYVIAPDLFNRQTFAAPADAQALIDQIGEAAQAHVTAALNALITHNRCNAKVAVVGWGLGGEFALRTALVRDDLRAVVTFYGLPDDFKPAEWLMLECPVLVLLGGQDSAIPPAVVENLRQTLARSGVPHELVVYPDAGRGFFDDSRPTFHSEAAVDAWHRALDLLNRQLDVAPLK
jgi:carboxymethylenebutenolidase